MNEPYVFLSYAHEDKEIVEKIYLKLEEAGFKCWIDKDDIRAMEHFPEKIVSAIDDCAIFLPFYSKHYMSGKFYCDREFDHALDRYGRIMPVCIDDVTESKYPKQTYRFTFIPCRSILGYGTGTSLEDLDDFCLKITQSVYFEQMKKFSQSHDAADLPPITINDYLLSHLNIYNKRQYKQSGNYVLNEIYAELFPAIKDTELDIEYKDDENQRVSLINCVEQAWQDEDKKHVFLFGEGGMGKTVSLLKTCDYLLDNRICAVYVPLNKINSSLSFDKYLLDYVCDGNEWIFKDLKMYMSAGVSQKPGVVFLLDGVNEAVPEDIEKIIKTEIRDRFMKSNRGVQFVISSRFLRAELGLQDYIHTLEMQALDGQKIKEYLKRCNVYDALDHKMYQILKTPLMLTLYANVEQHREKYSQISHIQLYENPDTPGKILSNFFQTQLFRAAAEANFDLASHLVLLEYFLPDIASKMVLEKSFYADYKTVTKCKNSIKRACAQYTWYEEDRLGPAMDGRINYDVESLFTLAFESLHFLHKTDDKYEFLHQSFRDYFAACSLAHEIKSLREDFDRYDEADALTIEVACFPDEVLDFAVDMLNENLARPSFTPEEGWNFPGKTDIKPSEYSAAENILPLWRGKEGENPANAVYNLLNIMRIGRKKNLAWCDFSGLDLRKCNMYGCQFTEWYMDKIYPSCFDGAWINRDFFLNEGHKATVHAVCTDGKSLVFSGDNSGEVRVYDYKECKWLRSILPPEERGSYITDMAWNSDTGMLAVLYPDMLCLYKYSRENTELVKQVRNGSLTQKYRYVKFSDSDEPLVSYDLEPLIWYTLDGERLQSDIIHDFPVRCAKENPVRKEIVYSLMQQCIYVSVYDESKEEWIMHPALKRYRYPKDIAAENKESRSKKDKKDKKITPDKGYINLNKIFELLGRHITCVCFNQDGSSFLVASNDILIEFDSNTLKIRRYKKFPFLITSVCYGKDIIVVALARDIVLLEVDFTSLITLYRAPTYDINYYAKNPWDGCYYIVSQCREIKQLNEKLEVQCVRKLPYNQEFRWVEDTVTKEKQMCFLDGMRYSFDKDNLTALGSKYRYIDTMNDFSKEDNPFYEQDFINYGYLEIYGCSFRNIRGELSEPQNQKFLKQNGGVTEYER